MTPTPEANSPLVVLTDDHEVCNQQLRDAEAELVVLREQLANAVEHLRWFTLAADCSVATYNSWPELQPEGSTWWEEMATTTRALRIANEETCAFLVDYQKENR